MSDRTKAMDSLIAQDADLIDDRDVLTPVYLTGVERGKEIERAKILAWLKDIDPYALACGVRHACANAIEAKEHLK
jgi:hypothetical protein